MPEVILQHREEKCDDKNAGQDNENGQRETGDEITGTVLILRFLPPIYEPKK